MALTDVAIRNAKPREKPYKLTDAQGLYLLVQKTGSKLWYLKYRFLGKESRLAFGAYPQVLLSEARLKREETRKLIALGTNPAQQRTVDRKLVDGSMSFKTIALEWHQDNKKWSPNYAIKIKRCLESYVFPLLGKQNITDLKTSDLVPVVKNAEAKGVYEVAIRLQQHIYNVMRYAVQKGYINNNPAIDLNYIVSAPPKKHYPALPLNRLPELIERIDQYEGKELTRLAVLFCLMVFTRSSELRFARWNEFDFDKAVWTIPAAREQIKDVRYSSRGAKMKTPHLVPLSTQAMILLNRIHELSGHLDLVFPGDHDQFKPMSENTINKALRKMGYDTKNDICGHGFRTMACSALVESGLWSRDAVERQMSRQERNGVRAAYIHKAEHIEARILMMQWWGDYLDANKDRAVGAYQFNNSDKFINL